MAETVTTDQAAEVAKPPTPQRTEVVKGLRAMADFIEAHPEALNSYDDVHLTTYPTSIAAVARAGYGRLKKEHVSDWFYLVREFSKKVSIRFMSARDKVCKKVKVGEKIIPAQPEQVVMQQIVPAKIIPAQPERVEEIYEWDCGPVLGEVTDAVAEVRQADPTDPTDLLTVDEPMDI